ncbi:MAG: tRNA pseudouridine(55) synthase TruB [Desulfobacula sp.]|nr:tRNA pseudouridine(55) synthase TruB [Desulfobacula sp.]
MNKRILLSNPTTHTPHFTTHTSSLTNGIMAINKPAGISSAHVVSRVKKALGVKKIGHTGTLDPFATGLLLCAINKATRISQFFLDGHKKYLARVCLGKETDTYDLTGKTVFTASNDVMDTLGKEDIEQAIKTFVGVQEQVPPAFSALKHKGQPLYKLARQGKKIIKPPRQIEIFSLKIKQIKFPCLDLEVFCSSGTYVRSLAFDIGRKLGCGAHLSKLCRIQSSAFKLKNAIELSELEALDKYAAIKRVIPMSDCLGFMPEIVVDTFLMGKIKFGQKLSTKDMDPPVSEPGKDIKIVDDNNELLAIVQMDENRQEYNYSCVFLT